MKEANIIQLSKKRIKKQIRVYTSEFNIGDLQTIRKTT